MLGTLPHGLIALALGLFSLLDALLTCSTLLSLRLRRARRGADLWGGGRLRLLRRLGLSAEALLTKGCLNLDLLGRRARFSTLLLVIRGRLKI